MTSQATVARIRAAVNLSELAGEYVRLRKYGESYKGKCPFHTEHTASFLVHGPQSPRANTFYCFGCHAKGDAFEFLQKIEGINFYAALEILSARTGIALDPQPNVDPRLAQRQRAYALALAEEASWWWRRTRQAIMAGADSGARLERNCTRLLAPMQSGECQTDSPLTDCLWMYMMRGASASVINRLVAWIDAAPPATLMGIYQGVRTAEITKEYREDMALNKALEDEWAADGTTKDVAA